ncbi:MULTISPECIES: hypothetical protein [Clostridium]|uniref:hypothetical protein n=1 Tax=Clostridium TaxID=1485 RepID=UPI000824FB21|nr:MULTISPECIES: hypothetical protein [Clostridium]PJI09167.1 hypothetical protein CUB90_15375 [Clostridium sp. CT7]
MKNPYGQGFLHMIWNVKNVLIKILIIVVVIAVGLALSSVSTLLHILNYLYIFSGNKVSIEILWLLIYVGVVLILKFFEIICKKHLLKKK